MSANLLAVGLGNDISEMESVRALTLKDGYDYNNNKMETNMEQPQKPKYAPGYTEKDDLNHDGVIDNLES